MNTFIVSALGLLVRPGTPEHRGDCSEKNADVEPERPLLDVLPIEVDHILKVEHFAAATDLPQPCDAGLRIEPAEVVILVLLEVGLEEGPRPHERHLANEDVYQLWKLVETPAPEHAAETRGARVVLDLEETRVASLIQVSKLLFLDVSAISHRAELDHPEATSTESSTLLEKEKGTS